MTLAIRAEGLGKRYPLQRSRTRHATLRDAIMERVRAGFRTPAAGDFWALRGVSFEIPRGAVVGLLGRNGAGKSTLLKVLSRITEPTEGFAEVRGRVGSLLEVGTGFHPELSGRDNVFLSGAVLGMPRAEIRRKFDRIVAFAEVERFIDIPVKRYSSGMYVRLAFSVAAHLEPEILLVDEVLSVGDMAFQQRCLAHFNELTRSGLTIVLVSHNLAAIQSACQRALLIEAGRLVDDGEPLAVIARYRALLRKPQPEGADGSPEGPVQIVGFELQGDDGRPTRSLRFGERARFRIDLFARERVLRPLINFGIKRGDGVIICNFNNWYDDFDVGYIEGACSLTGTLPALRLVPEYYEIHTHVWPWGGGHLSGDLSRTSPLAAATFGDFIVEGPGLNWHDGVFQMPAVRWTFQRGDMVLESPNVTEHAIDRVFAAARVFEPPVA
jgi:lipopolysaccharide transport system ATP-binding protein